MGSPPGFASAHTVARTGAVRFYIVPAMYVSYRGDGMAGLLEGKVGLVTGAAQGLGHAIAALAVREGSKVVLADVQAERGRAAADEISRQGGETLFVETDVSDAGQVAALVERSVARFGRLDWACNNAVG